MSGRPITFQEHAQGIEKMMEGSPEHHKKQNSLKHIIREGFSREGLHIDPIHSDILACYIAFTSFDNTYLHSFYFPDKYTEGQKPEIIPEQDLQIIEEEKYNDFSTLRDFSKRIEQTLPEDQIPKFREVLDEATKEHGSENTIRCAYHLSERDYNLLHYHSSDPRLSQFAHVSESALLSKYDPKFLAQFQTSLQYAARGEIQYLERYQDILLDDAGRVIFRENKPKYTPRPRIDLINEATEPERFILAPKQQENPFRKTGEPRPIDRAERRVGFSATVEVKKFDTEFTYDATEDAYLRGGKALDFKKPDLLKAPERPTLSKTTDDHYYQKHQKRKDDLVAMVVSPLDELKKADPAHMQEHARETVRIMQDKIPEILALYPETNFKLLPTTTESKLLLRHINRISRDMLKDAGIEVKRTWKEAFQDAFATKSIREDLKKSIELTAPQLMQALKSHLKITAPSHQTVATQDKTTKGPERGI